jgi:hypothetical protein
MRDQVRDAEGYARAQVWVINHLMEPRFDNPYTAMPTLGITYQQAEILANYILPTEEEFQQLLSQNQAAEPPTDMLGMIKAQVQKVIPTVGYRHLALFFGVGLISGGGAVWLIYLYSSRRKKKNKSG